jgi:uncharacterized Zn-finger protein
MNESETIEVSFNIETISCEGSQDSLGHPKVFYAFDDQNRIICNYCGKTYIRSQKTKKENKNV